MIAIDLNADLGDGFGTYRCGDDTAMLDIITSANIACGFHAGDPEIMAATFDLAAQQSVAIGAHPGFPDLWGFGRRRIPFTTAEIERLIAYQVGAAAGITALCGHRLRRAVTTRLFSSAAADRVPRSIADTKILRSVKSNFCMLSSTVKAASMTN
ncbi:hypothetical protein DXT91_28215 [Agrobacterium tumefaciens]|uniref:LamB/YcsF family protein n=1 Tax=Agrobacterium tumefaciens TaxID=358 RepID=UPI0012B99902|nr:hypothetical protein [Agrobacterium tumefaciens]